MRMLLYRGGAAALLRQRIALRGFHTLLLEEHETWQQGSLYGHHGINALRVPTAMGERGGTPGA